MSPVPSVVPLESHGIGIQTRSSFPPYHPLPVTQIIDPEPTSHVLGPIHERPPEPISYDHPLHPREEVWVFLGGRGRKAKGHDLAALLDSDLFDEPSFKDARIYFVATDANAKFVEAQVSLPWIESLAKRYGFKLRNTLITKGNGKWQSVNELRQ